MNIVGPKLILNCFDEKNNILYSSYNPAVISTRRAIIHIQYGYL